jgi:hypothetical protein
MVNQGLGRVQGRVAVSEGAPQRRTEVATGHCIENGWEQCEDTGTVVSLHC